MEYKIPVTKDNICKAIITVLNFKLGLSPIEVDILSIMLNNKITIVDTHARGIIRTVLDRDKYSTNNYIKRLKDKKIILQDGRKLFINPTIIALCAEKIISFNFIL